MDEELYLRTNSDLLRAGRKLRFQGVKNKFCYLPGDDRCHKKEGARVNRSPSLKAVEFAETRLLSIVKQVVDFNRRRY